jgi:hypothetical protein
MATTEHNILIDKWKNDPNLKVGPLMQPSESEKSINCECGSRYTPENKHHHFKTKKHLLFIQKNDTETNLYKKNRIVRTNDSGEKCVYETCVRCGTEYPLTPDYFNTERGYDSYNIKIESGKEVISNNPSSGCRECSLKLSKIRSQTIDEIMRMMIKKDNGDLTKEWLKSQLEKQNYRCHITNLPIVIERGYYYSASVQNNGAGKMHYKEHCVIIMQCLQVQEHSISNLKEAWERIKHLKDTPETNEELFLTELEKKWLNTPKQNGVTAPVQIHDGDVSKCCAIIKSSLKECGNVCVNKYCWKHLSKKEKDKINDNIKSKKNPEYSSQCSKLHIPRILRDQVERYYSSDKKSKKRTDKHNIIKLKPEDILQKLRDQKGKCYLSDVFFSFNMDDPNFWSLERLDNTKHHTIENTVLVCRIMNGATRITKDIIEKIFHSLSI